MSGLEALGAVSSIVQLAQFTRQLVICLRDLSRNVYRSSERFKIHKQRTDELQQIVDLITRNEQLQSDALKAPTDALVKTINLILNVLAKKFVNDPSNSSKKWTNRVKGARISQAESFLSARFDDLERHKSTLGLALLETLGGSIHHIGTTLATDIPEIQRQGQRIENLLLSCANVGKDGGKPRRSLAHTKSEPCLSMDTEDAVLELVGSGNEPRPKILGTRSTDSVTLVPEERLRSDIKSCGYPEKNKSSWHKETGKRTYEGNMALHEALQLNGNVGADYPGTGYLCSQWSKNAATEKGQQINGDIFDANFATAFFAKG